MRLKIILLILLSGALLGFSTPFSSPPPLKTKSAPTKPEDMLSKDVLRFNRELQVIKAEYVQPTSEHQLLQNAMQGMANGLDPHSSFLDADDLRDLQTATTGEFSGLGLEVAMEDGLLHVVTPIDDGPAQKAGIKSGDWILRINNSPIQGLTLREAVKKMRGEKGTLIHLTLIRKGLHKPFTTDLKREIIRVRSVKGRLLEPNFAYVRISSFQESTRKDLDSIINQLQHKQKTPLKGLILDLRNNPGGLLTSASDVANAFLDPNKMGYHHVIVYTQGQTPEANMKLIAKPNNQVYREAMIVLINQGSASGAEIVAGALQDNKRAVILGTKSFGKGSVQTVIPLDETSALKLTTALYYTPSGRSIQAAGILPDITLDELKVSTVDEDPVDSIYLHESELKGHLQNGNASPKNIFEMPTTIASNDLVKNDYQLFEAFNLLKGMVVLQETPMKG
ncbi:S41 family peptidase [Rickettsiella endosymbiont of Dermanyssus gallinae]|uniref:S41 family peptidase n=1 Tax=Rickettsiella endosymbiont of Dermanyssus gallinae TaxID=2856608 RepID=UPI001C52E890|nr:S41 family peptidase [Rickettsiella endosymbiont of Dermanyssus gallinae]